MANVWVAGCGWTTTYQFDNHPDLHEWITLRFCSCCHDRCKILSIKLERVLHVSSLIWGSGFVISNITAVFKYSASSPINYDFKHVKYNFRVDYNNIWRDQYILAVTQLCSDIFAFRNHRAQDHRWQYNKRETQTCFELKVVRGWYQSKINCTTSHGLVQAGYKIVNFSKMLTLNTPWYPPDHKHHQQG